MTSVNNIATAIVSGLLLAACVATPGARAPRTAASSEGSRAPCSDGSCWVSGRSYTGDDLRRTGSTNVADGLALLDSSITVKR